MATQAMMSDTAPSTVADPARCGGADVPTSTPVVLILDDEPSLHRVLGGMLHLHGFTALHATNLAQLKSHAEREPVRAFVLDLNLDGKQSGIDALWWLRDHAPYARTPVILLTGLLDLTPDHHLAFQQHRAHVFHKGQSLQPLITLLKQLMAEAGPQ
jgi:DNA-binding response OmpR family regulator